MGGPPITPHVLAPRRTPSLSHHSPRCAPRCPLHPSQTSKIESSYLSQPSLDMAASWKSLQTGFASLNLGQSAGKLTRGLSSTVQATKERLGQVAAEDITELPQGTCTEQRSGGFFIMSANMHRIQRSRGPRRCTPPGAHHPAQVCLTVVTTVAVIS